MKQATEHTATDYSDIEAQHGHKFTYGIRIARIKEILATRNPDILDKSISTREKIRSATSAPECGFLGC